VSILRRPWLDRLVPAGAVVVTVLLVAVLVGSRPDGPSRSATATPAPADSTDARWTPGIAVPLPPTVEVPSASATPAASPVRSAPASAPARAPAPPPARPPVVAGESCPGTATSGYYLRGWYKDWYSRPTGGWTGDGCAGQVVSVPMSGDPNVDDTSNVVVWWFRVPAGAACAVDVFVPGTGTALDAAGAPATYLVYPTADASGTPVGQFTIDQVHNQGRWVGAGTLRAGAGQLAVRLATRGVDWGPGRTGAHLGVSALRARC
jgi:hypothetical protein